MTTLAEFIIITGADNRPPMLEKSLYDFWNMEFYMENRENGRMILDSVQNGPLVWPTVIQEDGLLPDVYAIFNHHKVAKEIWDRVKLLMQGTKLSLQERECKLYDEFDKFSFVKGETLYQYDWRFAQLINNMNVITMSMRQVQVNTKVTMQQVQGRQGQSYVGTGYKGNATSFGGNNIGRQTKVVKCYNCQAQEAGQILDEEQLAFLENPGIPDSQAAQKTILNNAAFQTEDLDSYDSDCDDVSNAKAILMANLSSYDSDVILELFKILIWEDIIHKLNKKTREKLVPYPSGLKRKQSLNHTSESKIEASKSKTGQSDKENQSSSAKEKSPSHPSGSTPVVPEMHKEKQQAAGSPASLKATSEEKAHLQLSSGCDASADSTTKVNLRKYAPNDSIPHQHGMDEGTKNSAPGTNKECKSDEISKKIKLENLLDLMKDTRSAFFTPDSKQDEPIIVSDKSEEVDTKKDKDTHATMHDVPDDTSVLHPPSLKSA
nr:hypothetical protein [Tanacetum cinerariifolium]